MPDGDRYSRNVERRWQKAACYIYERDDPQLVVREVMLQLGAELSDDGGDRTQRDDPSCRLCRSVP